MKRPSSAAAEGAKKKPAASGSIRETVDAIQDWAEQRGEGEESEVRDKQKAQKFHKMLSNGSLPDHIVHMFQVESKTAKEGQRAYQTKLINSLFEKGDDGSFRVMSDRQQFQEYRKVWKANVAKDKTEAMPKTLMLASHFHGNEALMNQAINNGELMSKIDPVSKLEYLQFRKFSHTELRGNESGEQVQGDKKLNKEQAHALADSMSKLKWTFTLSKVGGLHGVGQLLTGASAGELWTGVGGFHEQLLKRMTFFSSFLSWFPLMVMVNFIMVMVSSHGLSLSLYLSLSLSLSPSSQGSLRVRSPTVL